jgi:peptidoglycan/LPS O-acetylase OafA/YrhL
MSQRKIIGIDQLRGVAALGVAVCHIAGAFYGVDRYSPGPVRLFGWAGQVGVALFFVISGFCIRLPLARARAADSAVRLDLGDYLSHRAWRILPPYWLAIGVAVVVGAFSPVFPLDGTHRPLDIALHLVGLHTLWPASFASINGVFWTIGLEMQFYLAYLLFANRPIRPGMVAGLLVLALLVYGAASKAFPTPSPWRSVGQVSMPAMIWQWALGAMLADAYVRRPPVLPAWASWSATAGAVLLCLVLGLGDPVVLQVHLTYWLLPFACALVVASVLPRRGDGGRLGRPLAFCGRISYSLYLFHPAAIALVYLAVHRDLLPGWAGAPLSLAGALLLAWAGYGLIERPVLARRSALRAAQGGQQDDGQQQGVDGADHRRDPRPA